MTLNSHQLEAIRNFIFCAGWDTRLKKTRRYTDVYISARFHNPHFGHHDSL